MQQVVARWPVGITARDLSVLARDFDPSDWQVAAAVLERRPDVLVTSNVADLQVLSRICAVETPSRFLARFDVM